MNQFANRPVRWAAVVVLMVGAVAASGCAGRGRSYSSTPESRVSRVAQRPAFGPDGDKKVYLGGYAGADYTRAARGR